MNFDSAPTSEGPYPPRRLRSAGDWRELVSCSKDGPVLLFKHSSSCSISAFVFDDFRRFLSDREPVPCGLVMVIEDRDLSNAISRETGIRHESPQLIIISKEKPIWHASHWSIDLEEVDQVLTNP